jgi:hypothetical protein
MHLAGTAIVMLGLLAACGDDDSGSGMGFTGDAAIDAPRFLDAPFQCAPVVPATPPACLALDAATFQGTTPMGTLDADLDYFGAGDCITITRAYIRWTGACGETIGLGFSYPVHSAADNKRYVNTSFDTDARLELDPPDDSPVEDVTRIHVDVVTWQEGEGVHDIDITVSFTEAGYSVAPIHVKGTFCDWPYYVC